MSSDKFVCGTGGWCISPAASFAFKTPMSPLTTNLGKHDFIIITTKALVPSGVVTISVSGITMGPITERKDEGFKISQDDTAIESAFVPSVALTSQLFAALNKFASSFTQLKFDENMGIDSSGAYVLWISTAIFVCASLGLLALSTKYPPDSMMVFFICSIYTTVASVAYLLMALGEGKLKEPKISRSGNNMFFVENQIKLPVVFYARYHPSFKKFDYPF